MKIYKIRDTQTGLFSTGGAYPSWRKSGKVWQSTGTLRAHLTYYKKWGREIPANWEVVEFEISETTIAHYTASNF